MAAWQWRRAVESPWFYAASFCLFAAAALFVVQRKYGERQAGIERRFQARTQPLRVDGGESPLVESEEAADYYSTADDTVISIWPLAMVMVVLSCVFGVLAFRAGYRVPSAEAAER